MRYHIVMGDVVASSALEARVLRKELKALVSACNDANRKQILSPLTITLGDEFQGVAASLTAAIQLILFLEEQTLKRNLPFRLHYVAHFGNIETAINPDIAYEMLGPGLTRARSILATKMKNRPRFTFAYDDELTANTLNDLFFVLEHISARWHEQDYALIYDMINLDSDREVAEKNGRDRSLVWKRRSTLRISEYRHQKRAITLLAEHFDARLKSITQKS